MSACIGAKLANPESEVVGVVGDYSFQFLLEEMAVAAQYQVPFVMVLINNAYLGLIRQAERGYKMDYEVQLSFHNINAPEIGDDGVDHVKAVEALGGIATRVFDPRLIGGGSAGRSARRKGAARAGCRGNHHQRITNIAMGPEIDQITEFEEILCLDPHAERIDEVSGSALDTKPELVPAGAGR